LVGITGTNGRLPSLLYYQLFKTGFKVGLISTVKILVDDIDTKQHIQHQIQLPLIITWQREMQVLNIVLWK
jgi:hypothetical protein